MMNEPNELYSFKNIIEKLIIETKKELEKLYDTNKISNHGLDRNASFQDDIDVLSPISVLIHDQHYSKEQFIMDGVRLFGYDLILDDPKREKRKKILIKKLKINAKKIRKSYKHKFSKEYIHYQKFKNKSSSPYQYDSDIIILQQAIKTMFLLKAHYIKYQILIDHNNSDKEHPELEHFLCEYKKFVEYQLEDLHRVLDIAEKVGGSESGGEA